MTTPARITSERGRWRRSQQTATIDTSAKAKNQPIWLAAVRSNMASRPPWECTPPPPLP